MSTEMWQKIQQGMGYSDEEMARVIADPHRRGVMEAGPLMVRRKIVAEVVDAHTCAAHKAGTKYVIRANGVIRMEDQAPGTIMCLSALAALAPTAHVISDRCAQGQDPKGSFTSSVHCPDTGPDCGGFGTALFKVTVE